MAHLHLENIGPIRVVDVDLRRYNVFIGSQSSGKSTIAKMISFCSWIEKKVATTLSENVFKDSQSFIATAEAYHKMHGYFNANSVVRYSSDLIRIDYEGEKLSIQLLNREIYHRKKIVYIPSDRNLVSMPELEKLVVANQTNLQSFTFDWLNARNAFDKVHRLNLLNLNMQYYYDSQEKEYKDKIIHTNGQTYDISLYDASSGLQSITPLVLMANYYTGQYFTEFEKYISFEKQLAQQKLLATLAISYPTLPYPSNEKIEEDHSVSALMASSATNMLNAQAVIKQKKLYYQLTTPNSTNFIIEEPEQNLFPSTQAQFVSYLMQTCNEGEKLHELTITTHSPYILTQLNILLFAGLLTKNGKAEQVAKIVNPTVIIKPEEIGVFAVQDNGTLESVLDEQTGMISQNYLDAISEDLSVTFQNLYRLMF